MGKCRKPNIDVVRKWISRGDGQGVGRHYQPFYKVRDIPSRGRSRMLLGLKTGRVHHYFSDMEYRFHLLAEYEPNVIDIRERYALLPWEETLDIADELGIRHPTYLGTNTPRVITSDQVLSVSINGKKTTTVICIQPSATLDPNKKTTKRSVEKLRIEKAYWDRRAIPWRLFTEQDIPMTRVTNLDLLRPGMVGFELDWLNSKMPQFIDTFMKFWITDIPLIEILRSVAKKIHINIEHSFVLFSRAVWLRQIPIDIDTEVINHHQPLHRSIL